MSGKHRSLRIHFVHQDQHIATACRAAAADLGFDTIDMVRQRSRAHWSLSSQLIDLEPSEVTAVVVLSHNYLRIPFYRSEWIALSAAGYRLIPIMAEEFDVSPFLGGTIPLRLYQIDPLRWIDSIGEAIAGRPSTSATRFPRPEHSSTSERSMRPRISNILPFDSDEGSPDVELLDALERSFQTDHRRGTKIRAITGPAAVGKSSLAAAFADQNRGRFELLWWLDAKDQASIRRGMGELGRALGIADPLDTWQATLKKIRRWAADENGDWLIVFDNANDAQTIKHLIPESEAGHMLITTQSVNIPRGIPRFDATALDGEAASQYLLDKTGRHNKTNSGIAPKLATLLQGQVFALREAVSWIRATGRDLTDYIRELTSASSRRDSISWEGLGSDSLLREATMLSLRAAESRRPGTLGVLLDASRLAGGTIALELLEAVTGSSTKAVRLGVLSGVCYGLVTMSDDLRVGMHPRVAFYIRDSADPADDEKDTKRLIDWFAKNLPSVNAPLFELRRVREKYYHAQRLLGYASELSLVHAPAARLAQTCGQLANLAGAPEDAYELFALSARFISPSSREHTKATLLSGSIAGSAVALREIGGESSGATLLKLISEIAPEGEVRDVAGMNHTSHLLELGDLEQAEALLSTIGVRIESEDSNSFDDFFLKTSVRHNRAVLAGERGDTEAAVTALWDVVRERADKLGLGHPATTTSRIALAHYIGVVGDEPAFAKTILDDCWALSATYFGQDSQPASEALDALISLSVTTREFPWAVQLGTRAFARRSRSNDFMSASAVMSTCNFSRALIETERPNEALRVLNEVQDAAASVWIDRADLLAQFRQLQREAAARAADNLGQATVTEAAGWLLSGEMPGTPRHHRARFEGPGLDIS